MFLRELFLPFTTYFFAVFFRLFTQLKEVTNVGSKKLVLKEMFKKSWVSILRFFSLTRLFFVIIYYYIRRCIFYLSKIGRVKKINGVLFLVFFITKMVGFSFIREIKFNQLFFTFFFSLQIATVYFVATVDIAIIVADATVILAIFVYFSIAICLHIFSSTHI